MHAERRHALMRHDADMLSGGVPKTTFVKLLLVLCFVPVFSSPESASRLNGKRASANKYKENHGQSEEGDSDR